MHALTKIGLTVGVLGGVGAITLAIRDPKPDKVAGWILDDFDANDDGALDRTESIRTSRENLNIPGMQSGLVDVTTSAVKLLEAADVDGNDRATRDELATVVAGWDTNGNGRLAPREVRDGKAEYVSGTTK